MDLLLLDRLVFYLVVSYVHAICFLTVLMDEIFFVQCGRWLELLLLLLESRGRQFPLL